MACDIDDREGNSPSPMEPRLGRMFHSSATGRRRGANLPDLRSPCQAFQRGSNEPTAISSAPTRSCCSGWWATPRHPASRACSRARAAMSGGRPSRQHPAGIVEVERAEIVEQEPSEVVTAAAIAHALCPHQPRWLPTRQRKPHDVESSRTSASAAASTTAVFHPLRGAQWSAWGNRSRPSMEMRSALSARR